MNHKILEDYLNEICHYFVSKKEKDEILSEIKSHILEKANYEFGEINDESLKKAIENYGSPKSIAEKYIDNYQIISPVYEKYLFRYTIFLFIIHYGLIIFSAFSKYEIMFFPIFYIPNIGAHLPIWNQLILYVPMTFFYDFGLVCLFLYFVTQNKKEIKLPWFEINLSWLNKIPENIKKPKISILGLMVLGFIAVLFIYLRYNTLFFLTVGWAEIRGWQEPISVFNPFVSMWFSLSVIFIYFLEILHYISRFFSQSLWIRFIKDSIILIILWLIANYPIEDALVDFPYINLKAIFFSIILFLTIIAALNFLRTLIGIVNSSRHKYINL